MEQGDFCYGFCRHRRGVDGLGVQGLFCRRRDDEERRLKVRKTTVFDENGGFYGCGSRIYRKGMCSAFLLVFRIRSPSQCLTDEPTAC